MQEYVNTNISNLIGFVPEPEEFWTKTERIEKAEKQLMEKFDAEKIRLMPPGCAMTCDFWPNRLNLVVDTDGLIISIGKG